MAEYQKVAAQWRTRDQTTAAEVPVPKYSTKPPLVRSNSSRTASPKASAPGPAAPLHAAAEQGNLLEISRLLKIPAYSAHINSFDGKAEKPLPNNLKAVATLLNAGADPTITTRNTHCSLLHYLVRASLQQYDTQASSLLSSILVMVLEKGLKIDLCNGKGKTALHIATSRGSVLVMALLLQHKSDPNIVTRKKDSTLHIAVRRRDVEKVRILTNYKADPEAINAEGISPWEMAARDNLLVLARIMEAAKMRAQQRREELEREQQAMNEVAEKWREENESEEPAAATPTSDGGGGLDDLVASLTDPGAVQEIEATLGPTPDDPAAYTQYMQTKYEYEQKAKEEAAEIRRVQNRLLVPSNYQNQDVAKHLAAIAAEANNVQATLPAGVNIRSGAASVRGPKDRPMPAMPAQVAVVAVSPPVNSSPNRDSGPGSSEGSPTISVSSGSGSGYLTSISSAQSTSGKGIYATIKGILSRPSQKKLPDYRTASEVSVADSDPVDMVEEDSPDLKFYIDGETKRSSVRAATADRLILRLTGARDPGQHFVDSFLLSYRRFLTPKEVLTRLAARYTSPDSGEDGPLVQLRVLSALRQWLELHCLDFLEDDALKAQLFELVDNRVQKTPTHKGSASQLKKVFERQQGAEERKRAAKERERIEAAAAAAIPVTPVNILEQDVTSIAKQITLLEADMYFQIQPRECLNMNWSKHEHLSPNLLRFTRHFNEMSAWIVSEIVNQVQLKIRAAIVSKFILLGQEFRKLHNFTGVMEVVSGLGNSSVKRLSKTWEAIEAPLMETYRNLCREMSFEKNFKIYRELLKTVGTPCLPYFGMYLTDLTFIEEGNPDNIDGGLINFYKCERVAEVIKSIQFYQDLRHRSQYDTVARAPAVLQAFRSLKPLTEKEAYALSQRVEPRNQDEALEHMLVEEQKLRRQVQELQLQKAQADALVVELQGTVAYLTHRLKVATSDLRLSRDISALVGPAFAAMEHAEQTAAAPASPVTLRPTATPVRPSATPTPARPTPAQDAAAPTRPAPSSALSPPRQGVSTRDHAPLSHAVPVSSSATSTPTSPLSSGNSPLLTPTYATHARSTRSPTRLARSPTRSTVVSPPRTPIPPIATSTPAPASALASASAPALSPAVESATSPRDRTNSPRANTTRKNLAPERFSQVPVPTDPPPAPPERDMMDRVTSTITMPPQRKPLPPVPRNKLEDLSPRPASERSEKGFVISPRPGSERAEKPASAAPATPGPSPLHNSSGSNHSPPDPSINRQHSRERVGPPAAAAQFFPEIEDELKRISAFRVADENASANITQH